MILRFFKLVLAGLLTTQTKGYDLGGGYPVFSSGTIGSPSDAFEFFGEEVAASEDGVVERIATSAKGAGFIFERNEATNEWVEVMRSQDSNPTIGLLNGRVNGDHAVFMTYNHTLPMVNFLGIRFFKRSAAGVWEEGVTMSKNDLNNWDLCSLEMAPGLLFYGSCSDPDSSGYRVGDVKVRRLQPDGTWAFESKLGPLDPPFKHTLGFGRVIGASKDGKYFAVGVLRWNSQGSYSGGVVVYEFDSAGTNRFVAKQVLLASDGAEQKGFGAAVKFATDRPRLFVGTEGGTGYEPGQVYVFDRIGGTWTETANFFASDPTSFTAFGSRLATRGRFLYAGTKKFKVYVFELADDNDKYVERQILRANQSATSFGTSIAITSGGTLVVGETRRPNLGGSPNIIGRIHTYDVPWRPGPIDGTVRNSNNKYQLGFDLDATETHVVVGAPGRIQSTSGTVVVFNRIAHTQPSTWTNTTITSTAQYFGTSVSIRGNVLAIGSGDMDETGHLEIYAFSNNNWALQARLASLATDLHLGAQTCVLADDIIIAGAPGKSDTSTVIGAVYALRKNGQILSRRVSQSTTATNEEKSQFGMAVACNPTDSVFAVGSLLEEKVYIYRYSTNGLGATLLTEVALPSGEPSGSWFGSSIALDGTTLLVGAFRHSGSGVDAGAVFVFEKQQGGNAYSLVERITGDDTGPQDVFGAKLKFANGNLFVSAIGHDSLPSATGPGSNTGAVYMFRRVNGRFKQFARVVSDQLQEKSYFGSGFSHLFQDNSLIVSSPQATSGASIEVFELQNTLRPTQLPTKAPTNAPSQLPTANPSPAPTSQPTRSPIEGGGDNNGDGNDDFTNNGFLGLGDNAIPIVAGGGAGLLLLVAVASFLLIKKHRSRKNDQILTATVVNSSNPKFDP